MHSCLITGGTGTLGRQLVHELLARKVKRIVVFSRDEHKQYEMQQNISDPQKRLRYFIGDVRVLARLKRAFAGVEYVIHAAAMKRVEASEFNPWEAVHTNIIGAQNVIEAALDCGVSKVLAISTDKADNPTTLYGATKLCAERMFVAANVYAGAKETRFACIRLGNIAFSRGSVIPAWYGKPVVPVTDPECTRYWLTAKEAADHVLKGLQWMKGGECVTPLMKAFRVGDLVQAMGVEMKIIGLGPGERLHEAGSERAQRLSVEELRGLIA